MFTQIEKQVITEWKPENIQHLVKVFLIFNEGLSQDTWPPNSSSVYWLHRIQ